MPSSLLPYCSPIWEEEDSFSILKVNSPLLFLVNLLPNLSLSSISTVSWPLASSDQLLCSYFPRFLLFPLQTPTYRRSSLYSYTSFLPRSLNFLSAPQLSLSPPTETDFSPDFSVNMAHNTFFSEERLGSCVCVVTSHTCPERRI